MDGEAAQKNTAGDGRGKSSEVIAGRLFEQKTPASGSLGVSFPKFGVVFLKFFRIESGRNDGFESCQQNASIKNFLSIFSKLSLNFCA